jgi:glycosyltransferase involved in cell wall biosynthesis
MTQKTPLVSVVMPVYNTEDYLKQAVDSILEQSWTNFELIVIDDGSKDHSGKILDEIAKTDKRMKVVHQKNHGLVFTLNLGIRMATGEYIARMDADDISFPRRFEQQVAILDKHKDVVLVAGGFEIIDEDSEFLYREVLPVDDRDIKRSMLLRNPIAHGSVMFRKNALDIVGLYSSECGPTEDFELWSRLAGVGKFAALEQSIFRWRVNTKGISSNNNALQIDLMKQHTDKRWSAAFPSVLSAKELRESGRHYLRTYHKRGADMKNIILGENAHLAVQMAHRGHPFMGMHQLLAVATANRAGMRLAWWRVRFVIKGFIKRLLRPLRGK